MPPCEGDNDCYHECEEAEADGGHILQSRANKGRERRREEQHALTAQIQVQYMEKICWLNITASMWFF